MDSEASLELLNATHDFPCEFTIKVIGKSSDEFVSSVVESVQESIGSREPIKYSTRATPNGRHVSVTLEPVVGSAEQVLTVYEGIRSVAGVVMTM